MLLERNQVVDTDIGHAAQAIFNDHEARLAAIEDHLGFQTDETDDIDDEDEDDEDAEVK
jgi:hypothetical protein